MRCPKCKYDDPTYGAFNCPSCGASYLKKDNIKKYDIRDENGRFKRVSFQACKDGYNYHVMTLGSNKCSICGIDVYANPKGDK